MANDENAPKTVNEAVARILNLIVEGWTRDEKYGQRSPWQQFGLLWLGAMAFTWPLFTLHFGQVLKRQFSGSIDDKLWLSIAGLGISAVASAFPAWLAMTKGADEGATLLDGLPAALRCGRSTETKLWLVTENAVSIGSLSPEIRIGKKE